jgi:hypothetical protein
MRSYPIDSPEAAARIVAMTLLADGMPGEAELNALREHDVPRQLGLTPMRFYAVLREYCEDLQTVSSLGWNLACSVDHSTMAALLDEARDRQLRERLLKLCTALAQADGRIEDGEASVLSTAGSQWGLGQPLAQPSALVLPKNHTTETALAS